MRVLVAGASGVIGRSLVRLLVDAGHEVTGLTRRPERAQQIQTAGAHGVVVDAFDRDALQAAVAAAHPEVVVNQLTNLPRDYDPRRLEPDFYVVTNRLRREAGENLIDAAVKAGARRLVTQSIAMLYAPEGPMVKDEEGRPATDAPPPFGETVRTVVAHEQAALAEPGLEALVLRYGWLYGPGTWYGADGSVAELVRKRRIPVIPGVRGRFSFIHVMDAASATVDACQRGAPGIYNVVDDEPATMAEWLPVYARSVGAKRPRRLPRWLVAVVLRKTLRRADGLRGASNAKAKLELGWGPLFSTWRTGFREGLDSAPGAREARR